ncbi:MAG: hypothetical protein DRP16_04890 [Candidatus Aenigmatarchaeota archaeon]|nr:MAG: hypothetical protein DRP16_04890 [Candidatus Aenigmarchaeota archaeon]
MVKETDTIPEKPVISYCGICCSLCPAYRATNTCPGCPELKDCKIVQCAESKNIRYCFLCKEFPCKLFKEGFDWNLDKIPSLKEFNLGTVKWKPYSKWYIKLFELDKEKQKK